MLRSFSSSSSAASSALAGPFSFSFGDAATATAAASSVLAADVFLGCDTSRLANEMQPRAINAVSRTVQVKPRLVVNSLLTSTEKVKPPSEVPVVMMPIARERRFVKCFDTIPETGR